jgi:Rad3-related DNA helicase
MRKRAACLIVIVAMSVLVMGCGAQVAAPPSLAREGMVDTEMAPAMLPQAEMPMEGAEESMDMSFGAGEGVSDRMIVRTASLSLLVEDTQKTLEDIERLATQLEGYVSNLQTWRQNEQLAGTVTVRIPEGAFDQARERIKELAIELESENVSGQDVTEEYVDLEARLNNLEVAEGELLELLASAQETHKDAESILAIYNEITNVRQQIEQIKGRMQYLENSSALATLTITLTPEEIEEPVVEPGWEPLREARDAMRALVNALEFVVNVLIWVVLFLLPLAAVLAAPAAVVVWLIWYLRRRRRRRAKAS